MQTSGAHSAQVRTMTTSTQPATFVLSPDPRDSTWSHEQALRHVLTMGELYADDGPLQKFFDVKNAGRPDGEKVDFRRVVLSVDPIDRGAILGMTDEKKRSGAIDNLWVARPIPDADVQGDMTKGALEIRKFGPGDIFGIRSFRHPRGYTFPVVHQQWRTGQAIQGQPWPMIGQVRISLSADGYVIASKVAAIDGLQAFEFGASSLAKCTDVNVKPVGYSAMDMHRIRGVVASVPEPAANIAALYRRFDPMKGDAARVLPLEAALMSADARSKVALLDAAVHDRFARDALRAALNRLDEAEASNPPAA